MNVTGSLRVPQALAALGTLQSRASGTLNTVVPSEAAPTDLLNEKEEVPSLSVYFIVPVHLCTPNTSTKNKGP